MNRIFRVFVSSTFEDLQRYRTRLAQLLAENGCMAAGMEIFPAANVEAWETIKAILSDSDFVVLILGNRYGSIHKDENKSYTRLEYEFASNKQIDVYPLIYEGTDVKVVPSPDENDDQEKLNEFRAELKKSHTIGRWVDGESFIMAAVRLINNARNGREKGGYVRADQADPSGEFEFLRKDRDRLANDLRQARRDLLGIRRHLATGDEQYPIRGLARCSPQNSSSTLEALVTPTWNQLLRLTFSAMRDQGNLSRKDLVKLISEGLASYVPQGVQKTLRYPVIQVDVSPEIVEIIMNQFVEQAFVKRYLLDGGPWFEIKPAGLKALTTTMSVETDPETQGIPNIENLATNNSTVIE